MEVCGMGVHQRQKNYAVERPAGTEEYLLLAFHSSTRLMLGQTHCRVEPGTFLLYRPRTPQFFWADGEDYADDWVQFRIDPAETPLLVRLGIPLDQPFALTDVILISAMFRLLHNEYGLRGSNWRLITSLLLQTLLLKIGEVFLADAEQHHVVPTYNARLMALREKIYRTPQEKWTVEAMCREMNISRTHLHRLYTEAFGVTCYNDVLNSKIEYGKDLLTKTALPVHAIAEQCGFENDVSFMRSFKKHTGLTPSQFRARFFRGEDGKQLAAGTAVPAGKDYLP